MSDPIEVDIGGYALDPLMHDNQQLRGHPRIQPQGVPMKTFFLSCSNEETARDLASHIVTEVEGVRICTLLRMPEGRALLVTERGNGTAGIPGVNLSVVPLDAVSVPEEDMIDVFASVVETVRKKM